VLSRRSVAIVLCFIVVMGFMTPAAVPAMADDGKPPATPARAAPAEPSPYHKLLSALQSRLSIEAATSFAGTARRSDGGIDVYLTAADAPVNAIVQELRRAACGGLNVHIVDGMKNNLATLESVRDEILARRPALLARGIKVVELGVHVTANRVRVGVKDLTDGAAAYLAAEFGADRILVFEGGEYAPKH